MHHRRADQRSFFFPHLDAFDRLFIGLFEDKGGQVGGKFSLLNFIFTFPFFPWNQGNGNLVEAVEILVFSVWIYSIVRGERRTRELAVVR